MMSYLLLVLYTLLYKINEPKLSKQHKKRPSHKDITSFKKNPIHYVVLCTFTI